MSQTNTETNKNAPKQYRPKTSKPTHNAEPIEETKEQQLPR